MDGFELGTPSLVCRWRIVSGELPLANRHLRALSRREVDGEHLSRELVAWAKQHIEWTLADGSASHPEGVLMLIVDESGRAAMTVGDYTPIKDRSRRNLVGRAATARREREETGIAPEILWAWADDALYVDGDAADSLSGSSEFIAQLARTLGISVHRDPGLLDRVLEGDERVQVAGGQGELAAYSELFLVSDEHGVLEVAGRRGQHSDRLARSYEELLEKLREKHRK